jgi:Family of unknown function (DUF6326)
MSETRARLSTMWVFVLLNMIFADILSFVNPGFLEEIGAGHAGGVQITPAFLLAAAVMTEVAIAMVILARVLPHRLNRWANMAAAVVTVVYVIGGGSTSLHYLFFATIEVVSCAVIVWVAWRWSEPAASRA